MSSNPVAPVTAVALLEEPKPLYVSPLAAVPENTMKFAVGLLLTTFGTFWAAEGAGASWPGGDAALLGLLAFYTVVSLALVRLLSRDTVYPSLFERAFGTDEITVKRIGRALAQFVRSMVSYQSRYDEGRALALHHAPERQIGDP